MWFVIYGQYNMAKGCIQAHPLVCYCFIISTLELWVEVRIILLRMSNPFGPIY